MALRWYVVHVHSGSEKRVKQSLEDRIAKSASVESFGDVVIPAEQVVEIVKGVKRESSRKFYPGYILVNMVMNDDTWHIVTGTVKVTGFLGANDTPTPISDGEVADILERMEVGKLAPQLKYRFEVGDEISVADGPFANFNGTVEDVNHDKGKIKVLVSIFGRSTPVELDFIQVSKL